LRLAGAHDVVDEGSRLIDAIDARLAMQNEAAP
jgi:hypothetical protein